MKTLIIHGSPRKNGDSSSLAGVLKNHLSGEIVELSAYRDNISPCIDCRYCAKHGVCRIQDDMQVIYGDDFDRVVIASPVYMGSLPGPMVSLGSRFQANFAAKYFLKKSIVIREKPAALILTGGGKGKADEAIRLGTQLLRRMGGFDIQIITSLDTDEVPAIDDAEAVEKLRELAERWNSAE